VRIDITPSENFVFNIKNSNLTIYDEISPTDKRFWIPDLVLEELLSNEMIGKNLTGLPLRTRSKIVKQFACRSLGYPIPPTFNKIRPRFPGQNLDTYTQKSNNLQVWNEELSPTRRYAIIRISDNNVITKVKVIDGNTLCGLDTTGTLTQKYQARLILGNSKSELISTIDTDFLKPFLNPDTRLSQCNPIDSPTIGQMLPIQAIFQRLMPLLGQKFPHTGHDQERNRGACLHRLVCQALGYKIFHDNGQFPDIRHQLLEIKLQTSPTIDLGLINPVSIAPLYMPMPNPQHIRRCDVRYAVFFANLTGSEVVLTHLFLTNGASFFDRFHQFQGKIVNKKLQIRLPNDFFDG
jgi:hypothetical protein